MILGTKYNVLNCQTTGAHFDVSCCQFWFIFAVVIQRLSKLIHLIQSIFIYLLDEQIFHIETQKYKHLLSVKFSYNDWLKEYNILHLYLQGSKKMEEKYSKSSCHCQSVLHYHRVIIISKSNPDQMAAPCIRPGHPNHPRCYQWRKKSLDCSLCISPFNIVIICHRMRQSKSIKNMMKI